MTCSTLMDFRVYNNIVLLISYRYQQGLLQRSRSAEPLLFLFRFLSVPRDTNLPLHYGIHYQNCTFLSCILNYIATHSVANLLDLGTYTISPAYITVASGNYLLSLQLDSCCKSNAYNLSLHSYNYTVL